jgi:hypothetical protein
MNSCFDASRGFDPCLNDYTECLMGWEAKLGGVNLQTVTLNGGELDVLKMATNEESIP